MSEENARLYEAAQRRLREITTLYEVSQACLSISDQKNLLTAIIEAAARGTGAALGSVLLIDEEKGEYVFGAHYGLSEEPISSIEAELHIPLGEGLVGSVVTTDQPVVVADVTTDPRWIPTETKEPMRSFLGVPLISRDGQPLGALTLFRPEVGAFDENHARLLSICANQAAMAIENARLYEQAQQEIAERKQAEDALRESEERYRSIFENAPFSIWMCNGEGTITFANQAAQDLFGVTDPTQTIGRYNVYRDMTEAEKPLLAYFERAWAGEVVRYRQDLDMTTVKYDTSRRETLHFYSTVFPVPASGGQRPSIVVMQEDITEQVRAEEALRVSEERFALAVQGANDGIWDWDIQSNLLYWSPRLKELLGYADDELDVDFDMFDSLLHPDDKERMEAAIRAHLKDRVLYDVEQRLRTKSDEYRWFRARGQALWDEAGSPVRMVGFTTDITERKRAEAERGRLLTETENLAKELAVLNELGQALTARLSVEEVLDEAYRQASRLVDTTNFFIGLYDPEKDEITFPFNVSESEIDNQITVMSASQGITGYIVRNRTSVLLGGEDTLGWEAEMGIETVGQEAPSWLGAPLMIGDQVLGVMAVQSYTTPGLYDEHDRDLLTAIASPTAIAVQNARLFEETQARTGELAALREVNLATLSTLERDQVFEIMLDQLGKVIDHDNAAIKIITPDGIDKMIAGRGPVIYDQAMWDGFDVKDSRLVQEMRETGRTVVVHDVHTDERYARVGDWEALHSWVGAPLFVRGDFIGYLMVEKASLGFYDEHAAQLLSDFAHAAAIALENARLYEDIRRERDYSQALIATANALVVGLDLEGCITLFNDFCAEITGYSQEEVLGQDWFTTLVPERRRLPSKQVFRELVEQGLPSHHESLILTKDGRERVIAWSNTLICDAEGRPASALAIGQDVTERRRAEEALRESEERYRALYEDNPSMYFTVDTEGTVLSVNRFGAEQLGYTVEELVGQSVLNVFYKDDKKAVLQQLTMCLQNPMQIARWEFRKVRKDGSVLWVKEAVRAVQDIDGNTVVLVVCEDITERKKLEERLRQAQKMDAIGTLAGGIAHDFNNLLTPIGGFAELLLWKASEGSQQYEYLRQIKIAAERAATLTSRLLTFARRAQVEVCPLNLNDVAREVMGLLESTIDKAIAIELYLADDLATVEGDAGQLHQVLLNLCLNARDAMPDGGQLIIETQNMALGKERARTELDLVAGQYVLLSVTDTGNGMDVGVRQRLFEPFFTTKEQGRGLGLATAYGIVRGHGGTIHVYSEPGQGSTFKVYLPVGGRPVVGMAPEEAEVVGGTETVLVVDDEGSVRELLRRILEEGGYTVLLATDGVEAVELYSRLGAEIDLVVLDIIMPRMGGRKTYERLREINPEVKVLLSSGYSENGQARDILAAGARDFLQKPYDLRAVLSKVREVLDD